MGAAGPLPVPMGLSNHGAISVTHSYFPAQDPLTRQALIRAVLVDSTQEWAEVRTRDLDDGWSPPELQGLQGSPGDSLLHPGAHSRALLPVGEADTKQQIHISCVIW